MTCAPLRTVALAAVFFVFSSAAWATGSVELVPDAPNATPQRIVTAGTSVLMIADALYMFPGVGDRIVGIGRINQGKGNFLEAIDSDYAQKQMFDRNVGAEQIAAARPDLVILKSTLRPLGDAVARLGIRVVYVDLETPEQYQRDLTMLGIVLGQPERGRELARYYQAQTDAVVSAIGTSTLDNPRTLFLYADLLGADRVFSVPPAGWIQTTMTELAGGDPVWTGGTLGSGWTRVGIEQIAAWDPDVVTLVAYRQDLTSVLERINNDPTLSSLRAVQSGRLIQFPVDFYSWDQPDVRWILGLKWLAATLHPDAFPGLDPRAEIEGLFGFTYGMTPVQVDDVIISRLEGLDL